MQMSKIIILVSLMLASLMNGAEASTRAGRASPYAAKFQETKDNSCGITKKSMDRRFVRMYAAIPKEDMDGDVCGKCVLLSGVSESPTSRRFTAGVYAQIVDTKDTIESGEILLSHKAHKVTTKSARGDLVSWTVVDCPPSTNLRGRKMAAAEDA